MDATVEPTVLGDEVLRCWQQIPVLQRQLAEKKAAKTGLPCERDITLLERQLMPDHFHGIIFVKKDMDIALGDIIRGFMVGCTKAFNGMPAQLPPLPPLSPQICGAPDHAFPPICGAPDPACPPICGAGDHSGKMGGEEKGMSCGWVKKWRHGGG